MLLNRLTDTYPLYEYPTSQLPSPRMNVLNQGNIFLSAFEFYFYHFFNLPIRRHNLYQGTTSQSNVVTESLYPVLVEDYLNAFLPVDATYQAKLFTSTQTVPGSFHHQMKQFHQQQQQLQSISAYDSLQKTNPSPTSGRPSLLRKDFSLASIQGQHNQDVSTIGTIFGSSIAQGVPQQDSPSTTKLSKGAASEIWRSETIAKTLIAFWLESYIEGSTTEVNYPNAAHLTQPNTFSIHMPSSELLRCIRMFIKHAHYFANSCKEGGPYVPSSLR